MAESSPFYEQAWEKLFVTSVELGGEWECLPEWTDVEVVYDTAMKQYPIEQPVLLECGKKTNLSFLLENGQPAICYINKVELMDVWKVQEERFGDPLYRQRVLVQLSEQQFEEMKHNFYALLQEHCPKGKCFLAIEYECSEPNIDVMFYDKKYLNSIPQPSSGSCSSLLINNKPKEKLGVHGLTLRGKIIQTPLAKEATALEVELFAYYTMPEKKHGRLSELMQR